jgi:hypothetical protein
VPPERRVIKASACVKRLRRREYVCESMPMPVSDTVMLTPQSPDELACVACKRSTPTGLDAGRLSWFASVSLASVTRPLVSTIAAGTWPQMPEFVRSSVLGAMAHRGHVRSRHVYS